MGAIGVQGPGGFDQGGQGCSFTCGQPGGSLAEIGPGPGLHPDEIIAQGHPVEVAREDLVLAEGRLYPEAAADLHQLAIITPGPGIGEAGQLLGDG